MMDEILIKERDQFVVSLNHYLCTRFGYKRDPTTQAVDPRCIDVTRAKVRLYLRFKPGHYSPGTLVIASIEFRPQRKGQGRALLEYFVSISADFGLEHVAIESALSEDIKSFTKRFGFDPIPDKWNAFSIPIKRLKEALAT